MDGRRFFRIIAEAFADDGLDGAVVGHLPPRNQVFGERRTVAAIGREEVLMGFVRLAIHFGRFGRKRIYAVRPGERWIAH